MTSAKTLQHSDNSKSLSDTEVNVHIETDLQRRCKEIVTVIEVVSRRMP